MIEYHFFFFKKSGYTALLVDPERKQVHRADFGNLVAGAEQPQVLGIALFGSLGLRLNAGRVVAADLGRASAARERAHVLRVCKELDGVKARLVVGSDGT